MLANEPRRVELAASALKRLNLNRHIEMVHSSKFFGYFDELTVACKCSICIYCLARVCTLLIC